MRSGSNDESDDGASPGRGYRGVDRRGLIAGQPASKALTATVVAGTIFACLLLLLAMTVSLPQIIRPNTLRGQLDATAAAFAVLFALLCYLRWRLVGAAAAAWLGTALAVWATVVAVDAVVASTVLDLGPIPWIRFCGLLAALWLVFEGLRAPDVDATLRPGRMLAGMLIGVLAVSALAISLTGTASTASPPAGGLADRGFALAWVAMGVLYFRKSHRQDRPFLGWSGILFLLFGYSHLLSSAPGQAPMTRLASQLLEVSGLLAAIAGATIALAHAYLAQGGRLLEAEAQKRTAEARVEVDHARQAERAHEARNALTAIEGATRALQAYSDRLDDADRARLSAAVSAEISRLQQLVSAEVVEPQFGRFRLSEAISAVVTCERSLGAWIENHVGDDLVAFGSPTDTAEVVQNLLQNARRYGTGPIVVRAEVDGPDLVLRVEDQGPGIAEDERDLVFERGHRGRSGTHRPGSGLGLYVSAQLMADQGGTLRLEQRPGVPGACFALTLPGFSEGIGELFGLPQLPGETDHQREEVGQVASGVTRLLAAVPDDASGDAALVEHHHAAGQ
ncbi:sensor histidine kinase [Egicoccus sp. AB-alg6-2]|uniref:sensor histidine kinase n=1 Tax=Egicoccus sp. AB-alg6-2 TaxID=3242692 RepID=UPI00359D114E